MWLPLESLVDPQSLPRIESACSALPFSNICWMQSSSRDVPNSFSSCAFEAVSRMPWLPWLYVCQLIILSIFKSSTPVQISTPVVRDTRRDREELR